MGRKIKFRVYLPTFKRMSYDNFLVSSSGKLCSITNGDIATGKRRIIVIDDEYPELSDYVIQQFTGLKDINSQDIYEHDIIEIVNDDFFHNTRDVVSYSPYSACCILPDCDIELSIVKVKIIGNIHENPELIPK